MKKLVLFGVAAFACATAMSGTEPPSIGSADVGPRHVGYEISVIENGLDGIVSKKRYDVVALDGRLLELPINSTMTYLLGCDKECIDHNTSEHNIMFRVTPHVGSGSVFSEVAIDLQDHYFEALQPVAATGVQQWQVFDKHVGARYTIVNDGDKTVALAFGESLQKTTLDSKDARHRYSIEIRTHVFSGM